MTKRAPHSSGAGTRASRRGGTRRSFIENGARALGLLAAVPPWWQHAPRTATATAWGWHLDANGDGVLDDADRQIVHAALDRRRGPRIRPQPGWDFRADLLAHGRVADSQLRALSTTLGASLPPRPMVTCWHYGWYGPGRRSGEQATVRYLGGNYRSRSRRVEEDFNRLKEEFGISADLLSWIDKPEILSAYEAGYRRASNRSRRRAGLLYESNINLGTTGRIDFDPAAPYADKLVRDFSQMGRWLGNSTGPLLRIDSRPVIYLFGSHTFGTTHSNLPHVGRALIRARDAFRQAFGSLPYLIGDESLFAGDREPGVDRLYRARFFDAISRYHHYDETQIRSIGDGAVVRLDRAHRRRLVDLERRTMRGFASVRNRFTDAPVVVVPSSAAGFAKHRLPTVAASRDDYAALLRDMQRITDEHLAANNRGRVRQGGPAAPLVLVGSWNEEFEGHALMPASSNRAVAGRSHDGFDWLYAIKSLYGWNHWAGRRD